LDSIVIGAVEVTAEVVETEAVVLVEEEAEEIDDGIGDAGDDGRGHRSVPPTVDVAEGRNFFATSYTVSAITVLPLKKSMKLDLDQSGEHDNPQDLIYAITLNKLKDLVRLESSLRAGVYK
jgi:hypothetical protein